MAEIATMFCVYCCTLHLSWSMALPKSKWIVTDGFSLSLGSNNPLCVLRK
jgi:hypothetical protein